MIDSLGGRPKRGGGGIPQSLCGIPNTQGHEERIMRVKITTDRRLISSTFTFNDFTEHKEVIAEVRFAAGEQQISTTLTFIGVVM